VTTAQVIHSQLDIDGRAVPVTFDRTVPGCSSVVVGLHEVVAGDANFGVAVWSDNPSSAALIMRSMLTPETFFNPSTTLTPPVDRVR
jgi:hypothetical protein